VPANEGEHGVDAVWREALRRCPDVGTPAVDHFIGAQAAHERHAVGA